MNELRIGVVGLGVISRFYLAGLEDRDDLRLTAVCDLRDEAMAGFGPEVRRYHDHRAMFAAGGLDAVIVNVPNDLHAPICRAGLEAGIAVCVEKPLATRPQDAHELQRLSDKTGVPLFTAFHRRYNSNVLAIRPAEADRATVESVTVRYLERIEEHVGDDRWYLDPARCGGGCVADNGPNAFDLVRLLLGDVHVTDSIIVYDELGVDRKATVALRATSGATATVELDWSYPGELKDVTIRYADGSQHHADMLAGYPEFKGSLYHEYAAILDDFAAAARGPGGADPHGVAVLDLVAAAYEVAGRTAQGGATNDESGPKRAVRSELVKVLKHRRDDRGMALEPFASRCVRRGEIHELVTTDQTTAGAGDRIDRVGFLGFTEITRAGVLDVGDTVLVDGRPIGRLLGFDACHFPNHYNVLIATDRLLTGPELGLAPGTDIVFSRGGQEPAP